MKKPLSPTVWRRRRKLASRPTTPGIELRVIFDDDLLVDADSDFLYYFAKYGGLAAGDGWSDVLWAHPVPQSKRIIRVEVRLRGETL